MQAFDVIVVGGGVMGCAAAYALAQRGVRTLLLEAAQVGHEQGSSHGRSRIIRLVYGTEDYIALCRAAYTAWRALEREAGEVLFYTTGGLDLAPQGVATWEKARAAIAAAGVAHEILDTAEIRRRHPQFRLEDGTRAIYQADAGVLHADRCIAALADGARRQGAIVKEGERVGAIQAALGAISVTTGQQIYVAERLILAGGSEMATLLAMIGSSLPLMVSTEQVAYFRPRESALFLAGRFPLFIVHFPDGKLGSGFPLIRDPGLKLMLEHKRAPEISLEGRELPPDPTRLEMLRQHAVRLLPGLTGEILGTTTCRYTLTPDEDFVLDRYSPDPRIMVASACSGHGFKFGALFGEALADLAMDRMPAISLERFRMTRFESEAR